jgi:hypothetical protein
MQLISQGSQAPLGEFDLLVEGPWPISTSWPPGGLLGRAIAFWQKQLHFGGRIGKKNLRFGPNIAISWSKTLP